MPLGSSTSQISVQIGKPSFSLLHLRTIHTSWSQTTNYNSFHQNLHNFAPSSILSICDLYSWIPQCNRLAERIIHTLKKSLSSGGTVVACNYIIRSQRASFIWSVFCCMVPSYSCYSFNIIQRSPLWPVNIPLCSIKFDEILYISRLVFKLLCFNYN